MPLEPDLFHGEDQDGGQPGGEAIEQVIKHGQRRLALERADGLLRLVSVRCDG